MAQGSCCFQVSVVGFDGNAWSGKGYLRARVEEEESQTGVPDLFHGSWVPLPMGPPGIKPWTHGLWGRHNTLSMATNKSVSWLPSQRGGVRFFNKSAGRVLAQLHRAGKWS